MGSWQGPGNEDGYVLGTAEGWDAFTVVRWHGVEEISQPYRYEITLERANTTGPVDLDKLIDAAATFCIEHGGQWRSVHGILAEAEELDRTTGVILYRVLLVPHLWRARWRRRCRNFVGQTLFRIVSAVLENRSPSHPNGVGGLTLFSAAQAPDPHPSFSSFSPPTAAYRWDIKDRGRIDDRTAYPYVAQYNESDFDFVSRLLEAEGLSYYFEHGRSEAVFAITDKAGVSPMFEQSKTYDLRRLNRSGATRTEEIVRAYRDARRLRSRAVTVRDWDYNRSQKPLQAGVDGSAGDADLCRHFEFPAGEESIQEQPGMHAAQVRIERYDAERAMREGTGTVRSMEPGYRFTLHDADGITGDAKLLAVRVETVATAIAVKDTVLDEEPFGFANATGPLTVGYESRFVAIPEDVAFRPAMRTPKPRIHGVQSAVVTAEEFAEGDRPAINADNLARVRVRFPWDQHDDKHDKTPTSDWLRVSQFWGGAGYGALYTPRVGHEVLVAYMQGDPDRPVIVGRVYNATHPPPYDPSKDPTKSTLKSQSAEAKKEVDGFNEFRFEDKAKQEEIYLHAQRDLNEVVNASHSTSVGGSQTNTVGRHQTNKVHGHREHTVDDYETVTVGDDRTTNLLANEHHKVSGFRDTTIGANDDHHVKGWHNTVVDGSDNLKVLHDRLVDVTGDYAVGSMTAEFKQGKSFAVDAAGATITVSAGKIILDTGAGASIVLAGGLILVNAPGGMGTLSGPHVTMASSDISMVSAGNINAAATEIKLNG